MIIQLSQDQIRDGIRQWIWGEEGYDLDPIVTGAVLTILEKEIEIFIDPLSTPKSDRGHRSLSLSTAEEE